MVGTRGAKVGLNLLMVSSRGSGWGRGTRTSDQPILMAWFMAVERPKTWKKGRAPSMISCPLFIVGNHASICCACLLRLAWVSMTPFETPVVPPVYWYMATSSNPIFGLGGEGGYLAMQSFHL